MAKLTGRKSNPKAAVKQLHEMGVLEKDQTRVAAEPVLQDPDGGKVGPRLLKLTTFDEAAYTVKIPMVNAAALRGYIERQARPLEKMIRIANGQEVNGINPSWDDQKEAIYKLVDKVAPDLRAVEVTHDVNDGQSDSEKATTELIRALTQLAYQRRGDEAVTIDQSHGNGKSELAR